MRGGRFGLWEIRRFRNEQDRRNAQLRGRDWVVITSDRCRLRVSPQCPGHSRKLRMFRLRRQLAECFDEGFIRATPRIEPELGSPGKRQLHRSGRDRRDRARRSPISWPGPASVNRMRPCSLFGRGSSCARVDEHHTAESGDVVRNPHRVGYANLQLVRCSRRRIFDL